MERKFRLWMALLAILAAFSGFVGTDTSAVNAATTAETAMELIATPNTTMDVVDQDPDVGTSLPLCGRAYIPTLRGSATTELGIRYWAQLDCLQDGTIRFGQWLLNTPGDTADKLGFELYAQLPAGNYRFFGQVAELYANGTLIAARGNDIPFTLSTQTELVFVSDAGVGAGIYVQGTPSVAVPTRACDVDGTNPNARIISEGPADWRCAHRDQFQASGNNVTRIWQGGLQPEGLERPPFVISMNITDTGTFVLNSQRGFFLRDTSDGVLWDELSPWPMGNDQTVNLTPGKYWYFAYPQNGGFELVRRVPIQTQPTSGRVYLPLIMKAADPCQTGYIEVMGRRAPLNSNTVFALPHLPWNAPIQFTLVGPTSASWVQYQPFYRAVHGQTTFVFPSGPEWAGDRFSLDVFTSCGHILIEANIDP